MREKLLFLMRVLCQWTPSYLATGVRGRPRPAHIVFCMVDHFEPGTGKVPHGIETDRMATLLEEYPRLADKHRDADGYPPRRTWFFPPHCHRNGNLRKLTSLCQRGYGEIELHLHHGKVAPDTADNLERTIRLCIRDYSHFGVFGTEGEEKKYGFIHGDWALNNSRKGGRFCGVDNEISILMNTGCFADFTFPSCNEANPLQINSIYYADHRVQRSKAYSRGAPARVGNGNASGLLMIQGPLHPIWLRDKLSRIRAFGDDVAWDKPPSANRIDLWVRTWIHVKGKEDWVIVKVHTHGAVDGPVVLGPAMDEGFSHLEQEYNDGKNFILHYATARELYNIVKAAEAGETGSPHQYRDYKIKPPQYDASPPLEEASEELMACVHKTYRG
jgi:hypothetical protein